MKYTVHYKLKYCIVVTLVIIILCLLLFSTFETYHKKYSANSIEKMRYKGDAELDYSIRLKPNRIYDVSKISNTTAIENYVDNINIKYSYKFEENLGIRPKVMGAVVVLLEGYMESKDSYESIFVKEFDRYTIENLEGDFDLDYSFYKDFIKEVYEDAGISIATKINIVMDIMVSYDNEFKDLEFDTKPVISIPISEGFISINKTSSLVSHVDDFSEVINTRVEPRKNLVVASNCVLIFLACILIFIIKRVKSKNKPTSRMKLIRRIFKRNSSILIEVLVPLNTDNKQIVIVKSINDLVKISEEVRSPIYYETYEDVNSINEFYLVNNAIVYMFKISEGIESCNPNM